MPIPEIDSLLESLISAWNSRDLEAYASHWVDDADFVNDLECITTLVTTSCGNFVSFTPGSSRGLRSTIRATPSDRYRAISPSCTCFGE